MKMSRIDTAFFVKELAMKLGFLAVSAACVIAQGMVQREVIADEPYVDSLRGIAEIKVVCGPGGYPARRRLNFDLQSVVELALLRSRINTVSIEKHVPYLSVSWITTDVPEESTEAISVRMSLKQEVRIVNNNQTLYCTTWEKLETIVCPKEQAQRRIVDVIEGLARQFAADYATANMK